MIVKCIHGYASNEGKSGSERHNLYISETDVIGEIWIELNRIELIEVYPNMLSIQINGTTRHICKQRSNEESIYKIMPDSYV